MKAVMQKALVLSALAASLSTPARAADDADTQAIRQQLQRYKQALNASDAVFMLQHSPPSVGRQQVRVAYD